MSIEEQVREALRKRASTAAPSPEAWTLITERASSDVPEHPLPTRPPFPRIAATVVGIAMFLVAAGTAWVALRAPSGGVAGEARDVEITVNGVTIRYPESWTAVDLWPLAADIATWPEPGKSISLPDDAPERGGLPLVQVSNVDLGLRSACDVELVDTEAVVYVALNGGPYRVASGGQPIWGYELEEADGPCGQGWYAYRAVTVTREDGTGWKKPYFVFAGFGPNASDADRKAVFRAADSLHLDRFDDLVPPVAESPSYVSPGVDAETAIERVDADDLPAGLVGDELAAYLGLILHEWPRGSRVLSTDVGVFLDGERLIDCEAHSAADVVTVVEADEAGSFYCVHGVTERDVLIISQRLRGHVSSGADGEHERPYSLDAEPPDSFVVGHGTAAMGDWVVKVYSAVPRSLDGAAMESYSCVDLDASWLQEAPVDEGQICSGGSVNEPIGVALYGMLDDQRALIYGEISVDAATVQVKVDGQETTLDVVVPPPSFGVRAAAFAGVVPVGRSVVVVALDRDGNVLAIKDLGPDSSSW